MRFSEVFGRAFLDGYFMRGLFTRLSVPGTPNKLNALLESGNVTIEMLDEFERESQRSYRWATAGLLCGSLTFVLLIVGYTYLAMRGRPLIAGILLAIWPIACIADAVISRLRRPRKVIK